MPVLLAIHSSLQLPACARLIQAPCMDLSTDPDGRALVVDFQVLGHD